MKVLLTASVLCHIALFHKQLIQMLKERGHTVHVAAADDLAEKDGLQLDNVDRIYNIQFHRSPFCISNIPAYRELRRIIDTERYDIIHCNTPAVGVLTRLAARHSRLEHGTKVIYTAHGFHFYKGAPLRNWLLYYPIEKFLCRYTDILVTINEEDTQIVQSDFPVRSFHMHGVGADSSRFFRVSADTKRALRQQLGLPLESRVILNVGELVPNKNQATLIRAAAILRESHSSLKVLLAGNGQEEQKLRKLIADLHLENVVSLMGHKTNIHEYMQAADVISSCSLREGLGLNLIEGMMTGMPVVAADNRGHREFVEDGKTGFLVAPMNAEAHAERISRLFSDDDLYCRIAQAAHERAQMFTDTRILPELEAIYDMSSCSLFADVTHAATRETPA